MSIADALSRISQIQQQLAQLSDPGSVATAASTGTASTAGTAGTVSSGTATSSSPSSFADALAQAQGASLQEPAAAAAPLEQGDTISGSAFEPASYSTLAPVLGLSTGATGGAALPAGASSELTSDQQQFAQALAADTGLDPGVVSAWVLAEESGGAAQARQAAGNNDWLNIGYTDSGTYGAADSVWSDPVQAAAATAGWLQGQDTIPGYGTASSQIQAIMQSAGQPAQSQIAAIQDSGWASSGYPSLPTLYAQLAE